MLSRRFTLGFVFVDEGFGADIDIGGPVSEVTGILD